MALWKYYRFDFSSTAGADNRTPLASYEWVNQTWKQRGIADAPLNVTDSLNSIYMQVDTLSTHVGSNNSSNSDINILTAAVPDASTNTIGGKFDNSTNGYYTSFRGTGDAVIRSINIISTGVYADTFPSLKLRYDNNTTKAGYCTVFISFAI